MFPFEGLFLPPRSNLRGWLMNHLIFICISVLLMVWISPCYSAERVILDTDTGTGVPGAEVDDGLAILFAIQDPNIELVAITTVYGNVNVHQATVNALKVVEIAGQNIPVFEGCPRPLKYSRAIDPRVKEPIGGFPSLASSGAHAVEFIARQISANPNQITIVAVGPLTNIATLLTQYPDAARLVKRIIIMGGNIGWVGNITPQAEFNFWMDAEAADIVLHSGANILLVPLDITRQVLFTFNDLQEICTDGSAAAEWLKQTLTPWLEKPFNSMGAPMHDQLAVAAVAHPELFTTKKIFASVDTSPPPFFDQSLMHPYYGHVWVTEDPASASVPRCNLRSFAQIEAVTSVDGTAFMSLLKEYLRSLP